MFIFVRFQEKLVSALCTWRANSAEFRRSCVFDCKYKLQNNTHFDVIGF